MNVRIDPQTGRHIVRLHITANEDMTLQRLMLLVNRLNRFLAGSGLIAVGQGGNRILLLGLHGPISAQDTGLVMLWLWRQPQVVALGIEDPTPGEIQAAARLAHGAR